MSRKQQLPATATILALALSGGCSFFHHDAPAADRAAQPQQPALCAPQQTAQPVVMSTVMSSPDRPLGRVNLVQQTYVEEGGDSDVSVDPTGKFIVFASTRNSDHPGIYLQRTDGLAVTQLTGDNGDDASPCFSPDGRQVAFCSTRAGKWDIYVMDRDGRNVTQLSNGSAQNVHPSFSPDGSRVVYSSLGARSGQWELWTVNLSNSQKQMIGYGLFPSWSPARDHDLIAFQRPRARGSRHFSLWTLELIDGEAHRVTEVAASRNSAIVSPAWSPDGKRIAFSTIVDAPGTAAHQQDVWTINADGTNRQRVTDGIGTSASPAWGADNRIYFVSDRGGIDSIWSATAGSVPIFPASADATANRPISTPSPAQPAPQQAPAMGSTDPRDVTH